MKRKPWSQTDIDFLVENYANEFSENLAITLQRSLRSIYYKAHELGLKKGKELIAATGRMSSNHPNVVSSRFKKGHTPKNKGQEMSEDTRLKVSRTWFSRGHKPHNTKQDGSLTKRSDGYWWVRIDISKWRQMHVVIWEQANGPVKKGDMVKFRDGNHDNYNLDNLYLSNRADNMKDNTIHNYPTDVKQAIRTISTLNKVIKRHEKQHCSSSELSNRGDGTPFKP